jgi:hypothetical protein
VVHHPKINERQQMISPEHGLTVYSYDFQFTDMPGFWLSTDVTIQEAFEVLKTGLLRNKPISKVKMFAISSGDDSVSFIYDVIASKTGAFPWTLSVS